MLKCPVCELERMRVVETRGDYRRRKCLNCGHAFFTFQDEVCTRSEYYLNEQMARKAHADKVAAGAVMPVRRKPMQGVDKPVRLALPAPKPVEPAKEPQLPPVRLLATGHYMEEVPGGRVYRMKL